MRECREGQFVVNNVDNEAPSSPTCLRTSPCCDDLVPPVVCEALDACSPVIYAVQRHRRGTPRPVGVYLVRRKFEVSDVYGNVADSLQTFTVLDDLPPVFTFVPPGDTLLCSAPPVLVQAEAVDNCGDVTMVVSEEIAEEDASATTPLSAASKPSISQAIPAWPPRLCAWKTTWLPPLELCQEDVTLTCDQPWQDGVPSVVPGCGPWELAITEDTLEGTCGSLLTLVRTFTLTDDTGVVDQAVQTQTQVDDTPPSLNAVAFWPLNCGDSMDALPAPEVLDGCNGETSLTWSDDVAVLGCATPASEIMRTYTATDACGNQSTAITAAVFLDFDSACLDHAPPGHLGGLRCNMDVVCPTASDNCSAVDVTWLADTLGLASSGMYTVLNTFLASDACGNTASHTQVVTHVDATPPSWTFCPGRLTRLQCGQAIPMVFPEASRQLQCRCGGWVSDDWNPGNCGSTGTWTRTFQATDVAGNDTLVVQHIAVIDTVAPMFSATTLAGTLSCGAPWPEEVPAAEDGCGDVSYTTTVDSVWVDDQWTLNFTHVAMDACLNSASLVETLTVIDTTPPVFTFVAQDLFLACTDSLPPSQAEVEDACGTATWTSTDVWSEGECPGSGVWTRTYIATDEAGNQAEATQTLTVFDTVPPRSRRSPNRPPRSAEPPLCWTPPWRKTPVLTSP